MSKTKQDKVSSNGAALNDEFAQYKAAAQQYFGIDNSLSKAQARVDDLKAKLSTALKEVDTIKASRAILAETLGLKVDEPKPSGKANGKSDGSIKAAIVSWFEENATDWVKFPKDVQDSIASYPIVRKYVNALIEDGKLETKGGGRSTEYIFKG